MEDDGYKGRNDEEGGDEMRRELNPSHFSNMMYKFELVMEWVKLVLEAQNSQ